VNHVVPADSLQDAADELVRKLSNRSPLGLAAMKRLANSAFDVERDIHMALALEENARHLETHDYAEGLNAMREKRQPVYAWA